MDWGYIAFVAASAVLLPQLAVVPALAVADESSRSVTHEADVDGIYSEAETDELNIELTLTSESADQIADTSENPQGLRTEKSRSVEVGIGQRFSLSKNLLSGVQLTLEANQVDMHADVTRTDKFAKLDELWIDWRPTTHPTSSIWFGRKAQRDSIGWWWDEELVGLGTAADSGEVAYSLSIAQLGEEWTTRKNDRDPENEDIFYLLSSFDWQYASHSTASMFYVRKEDRSVTYRLGQTVTEDRFDESDDDLNWLGFRHQFSPRTSFGTLVWHFDAAYMKGTRVRFIIGEEEENETEDEQADTGNDLNMETISGHINESLSAWAMNTWVNWQPSFTEKGSLRIGLAIGSGTGNNQLPETNTFRQTELQSNELITQYYGVLTEPSLSNLQITSVLLTRQLGDESALHLQFNKYTRHSKFDDSIQWDIDLEPSLPSKSLGSEAAVVVEYDFGNNITASATAARFKPGKAFANNERDAIELYKIELGYEF